MALARPSNVTDICNMALAMIEQNTVTNVDSDTAAQAKLCAFFYNHCKAYLLSQYNWTFAIKTAELKEVASISETRLYDYDYYYPVPKDLLKVINLYENNKRTDEETGNVVTYGEERAIICLDNHKPVYVIEGAYLKSDIQNPKLKYVYDIEEVSQFSAPFVTCLVLYLAIWLTRTFNSSSAYLQILNGLYQQALEDAKSTDCQQTMMGEIRLNSPLLAETRGIYY